ncbi:hypothetical protein [Streptomyces incanus]
MASVLTEAVTVRDVCRAVSEQLPVVGAREPALYTDGLVDQPCSDIETGIEAVRHTLAHKRYGLGGGARRPIGQDGPQGREPARRRGAAAHGVPPGGGGPASAAPWNPGCR